VRFNALYTLLALVRIIKYKTNRMAIVKRLTEEQKKMKLALEKRVLGIYRELKNLDIKKEHLNTRIQHLEEQINKIGGNGIDLSDLQIR